IPQHPELIAALGRLAVAHTHLELALRYTVKTLTGLSVQKGLDVTHRESMSKVRKRIRRLFVEKKATQQEIAKLDALLNESWRLSDIRNDYLHSAWSVSEAGLPIIKLENHSWGPAPTAKQVEDAAKNLASLGAEINYERSDGFIFSALKRSSAYSGAL